MSLAFGPDGTLYLATRSQIFQLRDADRKVIIRLETKGNYPHNGLCGFAWDTNGDLLFGLGENLGEPYKLVGSDGSTLSGGGEGGSVYRCKPDGSKVSRIATGFWNPFGMCVDANGRMFVVDNDPDARGPCRLLHAVQGGDFGYRFKYGRKGTHPFQCWNGELPGTLPMVAGTSEAPSGIIPCDFTLFSKLFGGELLVTSWGDHTIERFKLEPRGASVSAASKIVFRGDENFRPVAFAIAPDGSVVFSDWVDKSYPVHGKGRIWRLKPKTISPRAPGRAPAPGAPARPASMIAQLGDSDPFVVGAALTAFGRPHQSTSLLAGLAAKPPAVLRLGLLLALRRTGDEEARSAIPAFLADDEPAIRRAAVQWIAEERLTSFADRIESAALRAPVTRELFEAWLAAREILDGKYERTVSRDFAGESYVAPILKDQKQAAHLRALALRMLRPDHPLLSAAILAQLFDEGDAELRGAVVRTAMMRADEGSQ